MFDEHSARRKFVKAMTQIITRNRFYACLLLNLRLEYTNKVPTMGTDGRNLLVNLEFSDKLSLDETKGVIVHEILHVIYTHSFRRKDRHPMVWNKAADHAINHTVLESGFKLPSGCLLDDNYKGKTAEAIYEMLDKDDPQNHDPFMADVLQPSDTSQAAAKKAEQDIKIQLAKAVNIAGADVPDSIRQEVSKILAPKVDWKDQLREFVQTYIGGEDNTWKRPNRNYLHDDIYLPTTEGTSTERLTIMIDTSGSIYYNEDVFAKFKGEIEKIVLDARPELVDVFYVDTQVRGHDIFEEGEMPTYKIEGGGGTSFVSAWPKMEAVNPACIIAFTDMYADFPKNSYVPTLWVVYGNNSPDTPFGKSIIVED